MTAKKTEMTKVNLWRRRTLGASSLVSLAVALVLLLGFEGNQTEMIGAGCLKAGLTLGAAWLAFPQIMSLTIKTPPRLTIAMILGFAIVAARPRAFPLVMLVIIAMSVVEFVGWVLKPFPDQKKKRRS